MVGRVKPWCDHESREVIHTRESVLSGEFLEEERGHVGDLGAAGGDGVVGGVAQGEVGAVEGFLKASAEDGDDVCGECGGFEEGQEVVGEGCAAVVVCA